jgi:hypothetical protein
MVDSLRVLFAEDTITTDKTVKAEAVALKMRMVIAGTILAVDTSYSVLNMT